MEYYFKLNDYCIFDDNIEFGEIIRRVADNYTSIYYCDILDFISKYPELVEADINENGWGGDLFKHAQSAECQYIVGYLTDHLYDFIVEYLKEDHFDGLTDYQIDLLASNFDANDTVYQLHYQAQEFLDFE